MINILFFRLFIDQENLSVRIFADCGRCSPGAFFGGGCGVPEDVAGGKKLGQTMGICLVVWNIAFMFHNKPIGKWRF